MDLPMSLQALIFGAVSVAAFTLFFIKTYQNKKTSSHLLSPPVVPGLPFLGNLRQLTDKKPYLTFTKWVKTYGPVYSIRIGSNKVVVLNSNDTVKEAIVTRYSSISSRKPSEALRIISQDKTILAVCDYNDFYKSAKRHILTSVLGSNAQKKHRIHRDTLIKNVSDQFHAHVKSHPTEPIHFRWIFQSELFGLAIKQALGKDITEPIYVPKMGATLSRDEVLQVLVLDIMEGVIDVDWRDFFPKLKWIPNKSFENRINLFYSRRQAVMEALIDLHKKRIASGEEINCYLDHLLSEANTTMTPQQILILVWESIIEASDTTLVTTEWAMYRLSKDPERQNRLFKEIQSVCGNNTFTEENLRQLPYLSAVFQETLRKHSAVPIVPLRYVEEDTEIGGYKIPKGTQIAINIHGCNMDEKVWEKPEEWIPERFLSDTNADSMELHKTISFGGGKRICVGALQAMLITCGTIGRLIQEFEWSLKDDEGEVIDNLGLTTHKLHPMAAYLKPRT